MERSKAHLLIPLQEGLSLRQVVEVASNPDRALLRGALGNLEIPSNAAQTRCSGAGSSSKLWIDHSTTLDEPRWQATLNALPGAR